MSTESNAREASTHTPSILIRSINDGSIGKRSSKGNPRLAGLAHLRRFRRFRLTLLGLQQLEVPHDADSDQHRSASIIEVRNPNLFRQRTSDEHRDHL